MKIELMPEELAEFTVINRAAMDLILIKADEPDANIPPCWLCMSEEARSQARENLLSYMNDQMRPIVPFTLESVQRLVGHLPDIQNQIAKWKIAELAFKKERQDGNPRAYFIK